MELGRMRRLAACTIAAGALVPAGAGAALACDGGHHNDNGVKAAEFTVSHHGCHSNVLAVASNYLGLSRDAIKADLKSGQTLGQIANGTAGKSESGLVAAYVAAFATKLDAKVAAGKLTAAQESAILPHVQAWAQAIADAQWTHFWWHH